MNDRYSTDSAPLDTSGFEDKTMVCRDCKNEFVFTKRDQAWYAAQNFSEPRGCKPCRDARKASRNGGEAPRATGGFNSTGGYNSYAAPAAVQTEKAPSGNADKYRNEGSPGPGKKRRGGSRRGGRGGDDDDRW